MNRNAIALSLGLLLGPALAQGAMAQGIYPLLSMDISRKTFTNVEPGKEFGKGPMNMFTNVPAYPPADFKGVVRSNFDTLYSIAWLDMTKEPVVITAPDANGRYYLLSMLDMWTDAFASPGWRTTGTQAGNFLVTPPGWNGAAAPSGRAIIKPIRTTRSSTTTTPEGITIPTRARTVRARLDSERHQDRLSASHARHVSANFALASSIVR